jgi:hypothetical protein
LAITILVLVVSACALPPITIEDAGPISTAAAQTVIAGLTQLALSTPASPGPSPTVGPATLTLTPEPPTLTPTETLTPTASLTATLPFTATLVFTPTPLVPLVSVSVPTNCRSGPGKVYRLEGALLVGETAEVFARDPTGNYWYIRNPDASNDFCWIWGEYATVTGNISLLPVFTPPPRPTATLTPTPSPRFEASYSGLDTCETWWAEIKLRNTGSIAFQSMGITVKDLATGKVHAGYREDFVNRNGCLAVNTRDTLAVGTTFVVSAPAFGYDPSGHKMRATITLCSRPGQNGTCVTRTVEFRP